MKKVAKFLFHRAVIVELSLLAQILILVVMIARFQAYFVWFYAFCILLSVSAVAYILNGSSNPGYKIAWLIPILVFPIFGGLFYLMFGRNKLSSKQIKRMTEIGQKMQDQYPVKETVLKELAQENLEAGNQSRYISNYTLCPPHKNTYTEFLPTGERKLEVMLEELKKAEHYIFLEYFIIEEGQMWNSILDVLVQKVKDGVDVRLIYDDMGCLMTLPYGYHKKLQQSGIKCKVFNPFIPVLYTQMNNRDHRKICVVDGYVGITGGVNLADEYINVKEKHGHWRDAAILLKGEAVWNMTTMFLSMWDYLSSEEEDYQQYRPQIYQKKVYKGSGYVQPFNDSPLDGEAVGETVYMNIINRAKQYVYINTPYLIVDNEMITALCNTAKQGVDVRIMTPHVADKKLVHASTRAYYDVLLKNGVQIYEYTPGFNHAKTFVADDMYGVVGTINLDYRSLYLHFECGVWMYGTESLKDIKKDFLTTLAKCEKIELKKPGRISLLRRLGKAILRAFAPLM